VAQPLAEALSLVREAALDQTTLLRVVGAGRRKGAQPPRWRRVELRWVDLKQGRRLQVTAYDERRAHTINHEAGAAAEAAVDELLAEPFGNWHMESSGASVQVRVTGKGDALVHTRPRGEQVTPGHEHDRAKHRLLDPGDPMLHAVGISDHQGRIKPSRQSKYRQVEEFLRSLDATLDAAVAAGALPATGPGRPLRVVDLGCGNAYLTFAAFAYITGARGLEVDMVGIDVNPEMRQRNTALAAELGWDRLTFVSGSIEEAALPEPPDIVLALHACDTATDEALARAVGWEAPIVLAAPCCHHDIQRQLSATDPPPPYGLVARHGILGERLADVLTDALRAALLRQRGYRVEVIQFVESRHTPRNTMVRAVRTGAAPSSEVQAEYEAMVGEWGVHPALATMLDDD
jgi:SAM-dependent methyltransferase